MNGKGSGRRPGAVSQDEWATRWAQTFGPQDGQIWPAPSSHAPQHDEELGEEEDGYEV